MVFAHKCAICWGWGSNPCAFALVLKTNSLTTRTPQLAPTLFVHIK